MKKSEKASLTPAELELTQKIQMHFPRELSEKKIQICNGVPVEVLSVHLADLIEKLVMDFHRQIGIISGEEFSDQDRTTENIRREAEKRGWRASPLDLTKKKKLEILEKTDFWRIIVMHVPTSGFEGEPTLYGLTRFDSRFVDNFYVAPPDHKWPQDHGFCFSIPEK